MAHKTNSLEKFFMEVWFLEVKVFLKGLDIPINSFIPIILVFFIIQNLPILGSSFIQPKSIKLNLPIIIFLT